MAISYATASDYVGPYLQSIVKEPPHTLKAATGKLVFPQPVYGILNMLFIHIDVVLCLAKSFGHKCSQPEQQKKKEERKYQRTSSTFTYPLSPAHDLASCHLVS